MQNHGPWKIHERRQVYRDAWIEVNLDQVTRPDGNAGTYTTVQLKSGVCVIALDSQLNVHLTSEFHYAVGRTTLEGVSGGIEAGEPPLVAAERELAEELGLTAHTWKRLGQVDPFTSAIHSTVDLFLATDLSDCPANPEGTELIERITMPLTEAINLVKQSQITHAPTCVAILRIALEHLPLQPVRSGGSGS